MSSYRRVWPVEEAGPIRGAASDLFHSSDNAPQVYQPRSVTLYSCGKCGVGLAEKEGGWPRVCVHCKAVNDRLRSH